MIFWSSLGELLQLNRVLIIGAGNIGSRHLQALGKSELALNIVVVDPFVRALEASKQRFDEVAKGNTATKAEYYQNLDLVGDRFDVGIVATTSDMRRKIVQELLEKIEVKNLILEKVAFQNTEDFQFVIKLLKSKHVKAWVNLPRRVIPFYREMKNKIKPHGQVFYTVQGGDWGLACNAIHFIDHLCFLVEDTDYEVSCHSLDKDMKESKRKGFVEFTGALHCRFSNGSELNLISQNGSKQPPLITIMGGSILYVIEEEKEWAAVSQGENGWKLEKTPFRLYYQSELTNRLVEDIIRTGDCGLTSIEESYLIHKPLLESFIKHLENITGKKYYSCPIT
jgi:predicted dehydrogenase